MVNILSILWYIIIISDPHPQRPGSYRSPTSYPCTGPPEQGQAFPFLWVNSMATSLNINCSNKETHFRKEGPWEEFLFSQKTEEERGWESFQLVYTLTDPIYVSGANCKVPNFHLLMLFHKIMISSS